MASRDTDSPLGYVFTGGRRRGGPFGYRDGVEPRGRERDVRDESASVCLGGAGRQGIEAVLRLATDELCPIRAVLEARRVEALTSGLSGKSTADLLSAGGGVGSRGLDSSVGLDRHGLSSCWLGHAKRHAPRICPKRVRVK